MLSKAALIIGVILRWFQAFLALSANDRDLIMGRKTPTDQ